jgi:hypothetical protein
VSNSYELAWAACEFFFPAQGLARARLLAHKSFFESKVDSVNTAGGLSGVIAAPILNTTLDPSQVLAEVHRTAHADPQNHGSVFIKGQHFVANVHDEALRGNHYAFVLSVDSVTHQGVIYRVCCPEYCEFCLNVWASDISVRVMKCTLK